MKSGQTSIEIDSCDLSHFYNENGEGMVTVEIDYEFFESDASVGLEAGFTYGISKGNFNGKNVVLTRFSKNDMQYIRSKAETEVEGLFISDREAESELEMMESEYEYDRRMEREQEAFWSEDD